MNYLAHAHLSGIDKKLLVGNMMGDAIKGGSYKEIYPDDICKGIELHRFIDHFSDQHPLILKGKKRLWDDHRHYSAVIIDMFYDHLLAKNWSEYSNVKLNEFSQTVYKVMADHWDILPEITQMMMTYMSKHDWLTNYQHIEGLTKSLNGISRRTPYETNLGKSIIKLENNYDIYESEFLQFYDELIIACKQKIEQL